MRFGYRDYDPNTGRWTAKDPIGFAGGDTDLFAYVQNDPVNLVDAWGLMSQSQRNAMIANWAAAGSGIGAMLGFLGGGGAGLFTGPGAFAAVPAAAYAGAVGGSALGGTIGVAIGTYLANMMDDDCPGRDDFEKMRQGDNTAKNKQFKAAFRQL